MAATMQIAVNLSYITNCCICGIPIVMADDYYRDRKNRKDNFYCSNGHAQSFQQASEMEKLKTELEQLKVSLTHKETSNKYLDEQWDKANARLRRAQARIKRLLQKLKKAGIK